MRRPWLSLFFCLLAAVAVAQDATVTFVDGFVDIRTEGGGLFPADFGDQMNSGDRLITDRDGAAELELATGGVISVDSDTVFIVGSETGASGARTSRVSAAIGSFAFRFNAALGNEPQIGSTTSVAGVRGTEVRVYTGSDGTTRFEVLEGLVEIENGGSSVSLGPEEAVEITPGRGAGTVFAFLEQPIDYAVWNAGLIEGFLERPVETLGGVASEMYGLIAEIERRVPEVDALFALVEEENAKLPAIRESEGAEAQQEYFLGTVLPLRARARGTFVELRFVALSALSLEQFVVARLAAEFEAASFTGPRPGAYEAFRSELSDLRTAFDRVVTPWLVPSDL